MQRHDDTQKKQSTQVTKGDLSRAIAQGRLPYMRVGVQYVVRQEDLRKLRTRHENRPEVSPKYDALEMGRTA
jgi:hypothetical protein